MTNRIFTFSDLRLTSNLLVEKGNERRLHDEVDSRPIKDQVSIEPMPRQIRRREYLPLAQCNHKSQIPKSMDEILKPCREEPFNCSICAETFPSIQALNRHEVDAEHVSKQCPSWICFFCKAQMTTRSLTKNHLIRYHKCSCCKLFVHSR